MLLSVFDFDKTASIAKIAKSTNYYIIGVRFRYNYFHNKNCQVNYPCYNRCPILVKVLLLQKFPSLPPILSPCPDFDRIAFTAKLPSLPLAPEFGRIDSIATIAKSITTLDLSIIASIKAIVKSTTHAVTNARFRQKCFYCKNYQVYYLCYRWCSISILLFPSQKLSSLLFILPPVLNFNKTASIIKMAKSVPCYYRYPISTIEAIAKSTTYITISVRFQ